MSAREFNAIARNRKNPDLQQAAKIAAFLQVRLDDLVMIMDDRPPAPVTLDNLKSKYAKV